MNRRKIFVTTVYLCLLSGIVAPAVLLRKSEAAGADIKPPVLSETIDGIAAAEMMSHYLRRRAQQQFEKWQQRYEQLKTTEQIAEYQKVLRKKFLEAIGGLPERTPLNPQVTGVVSRDGYRVEKVIFESQPKHYVSSLLFLPDSEKHRPPYPGVLVPCGHSRNGKAHDAYQTMGALLSLNGMVALVFDPIDQGERSQLPSQLPELWGTKAHTMLGVGSILLGRNTARFSIWDGMRGIDYLQSRPEVDPNRIGCTGNSGGGTQTSYLMALDDRIGAAAPSCYITSFERLLSTIGPQDAEQNIYGQLGFGMDHADYLMARAPTPILICAATRDFFDIGGTWNSFRYAKRCYSRMGFPERIDLLENDAPHNYDRLQREGVARWMARWLLGKDEGSRKAGSQPITEPNIKLLSEEESNCTPNGQVMLLEGARSTYELNRDLEKELVKRRKKLWETAAHKELLDQVREMAGIRKLTELPRPEVQELDVVKKNGYQVKKIVLKPEKGVYLPSLLFVPEHTSLRSSVLYVHENGKDADAASGGPIEKLVEAGRRVLAVDLRGTGQTQAKQDSQTKDVYTAYLLGCSYIGMRAEDILVCARFLRESLEGPVDLVAVGNVGVPALHAAALESDLFDSVKLVRALASWSNVIELGRSYNQLVNTVHGALTLYDLPDLAKILEGRLTIEQPLNALGEVAGLRPEFRIFGCAVLCPPHPALGGGGTIMEKPSTATKIVTVLPEETDELLANPGIGWETFHRTCDKDKNLPEWIPSTIHYARWGWGTLEPQPGKIDYPFLDKILQETRQAGQRLAFRVMCCSTTLGRPYHPAWLQDVGGSILICDYGNQQNLAIPDLDDPVVLERHLDFIKRLGARYDGHADIDHVDLGSVGWWGEWHMSSSQTGKMPTMKNRTKIIDAYLAAFRKTPLLMLIGGRECLTYAAQHGTGWRADCLGDMGGFSKTWCHMCNAYPQLITEAGVGDLWKTAPVAWESCWDMRRWVKEEWPLRFIFNYALALHGSYFNNKSAPLPQDEYVWHEIERFLRRLGYRLVLRELKHPKQAHRAEPLILAMKWQNTGSAPCYRPYRVAYQLANKTGYVKTLIGDITVEKWMPGSVPVFTEEFFKEPADLPPGDIVKVVDRVTLPADMPLGSFRLAIGVVGQSATGGNEPLLRLAIKGRADNGWYPLSEIEVVK